MRSFTALLGALFLIQVAPAHAARFAELGIRAGLTESRIHGGYGDALASELRTGGAVGIQGSLRIRPALSLQPELWWVMKGAQENFVLTFTGGGQGDAVNDAFAVHVEHSIPYVELPVLLRAQASFARRWEPYVIAGPSIALRAGGDEDIVIRSQSVTGTASSRHVRMANIFEGIGTLDSKPRYTGWDWGVVGGAGLAFGRGARRYVGELRYSRGFVDVIPSDAIGRSRNGSLALLLGMEWR
jgi:hypothetical protein